MPLMINLNLRYFMDDFCNRLNVYLSFLKAGIAMSFFMGAAGPPRFFGVVSLPTCKKGTPEAIRLRLQASFSSKTISG